MRVHLVHLGCRSNLYEVEAMASLLERAGFHLDSASPDLVFLNGCSVTAEADRKVRRAISSLRRRYPGAKLVLCGCPAQRMSVEEARALGVSALLGNGLKARAVEVASALLGEDAEEPLVLRREGLPEGPLEVLGPGGPRYRTRAFLKVQEGCRRACSYCVVRILRGLPRSKPVEDVLREVGSLLEAGVREVVLCGTNLGDYGVDLGLSLGDLVLALDDLLLGFGARLRLSSLEPFALGEGLLRTLSRCGSFCHHLHVPIQSGSSRVLSAMRRGYDRAFLERALSLVREVLGEDLHLTADLMVGFPGEEEGDFEESLGLLRSFGFGKVHVFPFSPRPGTEAFGMPPIPSDIIEDRVKRALQLSAELERAYALRLASRGCLFEVLVERERDGFSVGKCREFLDFRVMGLWGVGSTVLARFVRLEGEEMVGEFASYL